MENKFYDETYEKSQQEAYESLQQQLQDSTKKRKRYKTERSKTINNLILCFLALSLFPVPWLIQKPEINVWDLWFLSREQKEFATENLQSLPPIQLSGTDILSVEWLETVKSAVQNMPSEYDASTTILLDIYPTGKDSKLTQQQTLSLNIWTCCRDNTAFGDITIRSDDTLIMPGVPEDLAYNIYQEIKDGKMYCYIEQNEDEWYYIEKPTTQIKAGFDFLPLVESISPYRGEWTKTDLYYPFWRMYSNTKPNPYGGGKESVSFWLSDDNYLSSMYRDVIKWDLESFESYCLAQGDTTFEKMKQDKIGLVNMMSYDFQVSWWDLQKNYETIPSPETSTRVDSFDFLYDEIIDLMQRSEDYT